MSVNLPAGSVATVIIGDANSTFAMSPQDVLDAVAAELVAEGYKIYSSSQSGGILATITPIMGEEFQATYTIGVPWATDTDSLIDAVLQAHEDVSGIVSSQATIPSYTAAASSTAVSTGLPGATPTVAQTATTGISATVKSIEDAIAAAFAALKSTTITILLAIAAIIVIVLVLVAYGPNVKHIAAAVA